MFYDVYRNGMYFATVLAADEIDAARIAAHRWGAAEFAFEPA